MKKTESENMEWNRKGGRKTLGERKMNKDTAKQCEKCGIHLATAIVSKCSKKNGQCAWRPRRKNKIYKVIIQTLVSNLWLSGKINRTSLSIWLKAWHVFNTTSGEVQSIWISMGYINSPFSKYPRKKGQSPFHMQSLFNS